MDPTVTGALIGAGGAVIVAVAGFLANVKNTSVTTAVSQRAVEVSKQAVEVSQHAVEAAQRTVEVTEQGQVTDRYTKAVEQLGSKEIDVRIGGIYALERVALDSDRDHPTVMEVVATFVRDRSPEQWPLPTVHQAGAEPPERETRPDVQAAATIIGRRRIRYDRRRQPINLSGAHLNRADLNYAHLDGAHLSGAHLDGAHLFLAHLNGANLKRAHLNGADLKLAHLNDVNLSSGHLNGADLTSAHLKRADLKGANFTEAHLHDVDFTGAKALDTATLSGAHLTGAFWPQDVPVPEGWHRDADTGRLKRANTDADGTATD
jgi:hypothetical protein